MADPRRIERIWFGDGVGPALVRTSLLPAELLYRAITSMRGALYDRGMLPVHQAALPALSVGNLTVGGTGKTPIAAWAAEELARRGAKPAIILRGYGGDEPAVHARLHPTIPTVTAADRVAGAREALTLGADVVVLDDAFQHRRIGREVDWVLLSADRPMRSPRLLPAGPWREPLVALRRATVALVTRKGASRDQALQLAKEIRRYAPAVPVATVRLALDELRSVAEGEVRALDTLDGASVLLVAAIGDPTALEAQLEALGAEVRSRFFADHHAFTLRDIQEIAGAARAGEAIVCTLKDAVKLAPGWPRAAPALWYVSQRVIVEDGMDQLSGSLETVLRARSSGSDSAGPRRPFL